MKSDVVFITGNENKAKYLGELLGVELERQKIDLVEVQSLDLREVVHHKVREAYKVVGKPVLVEDISLEFTALGKLPGPFIKWFETELSLEDICRLLDGKERGAIARCTFGYFDGEREEYFEGMMTGEISASPKGKDGYGWDPIFIPEGYDKTRAELTKEEYDEVYKKLRPFDKLREFLLSK